MLWFDWPRLTQERGSCQAKDMVSIRNNILCNAERALVDGDRDFSPAQPVIECNQTFSTSPAPGEQNINNDTTQG
ncbi:MAG TPA: hypothetical protein VKF17_15070 [Isosphaeraceae bacterium]|nr:hypothetical protein [Isosphaeraceae bacterium]